VAQIIEQSDKFGRIGKAFGAGLSEQIPQEVDRHRLSKGLQNLEQTGQDLTPFQQFSKLASIPGVTPQMIQSGSELLKQQGIRSAYANKAGKGVKEEIYSPEPINSIKDVQFAAGQGKTRQAQQGPPHPEFGQPQINPNNPLRNEAIPKAPWTQQRLNQEVAKNFQDFPGITQPEAISMAKEAEQRELAQPVAEQTKDAYQRDVQKLAEDKFTNYLETNLQKEGKDVFQDVTGESLVNIKREMERDLRLNPNASIADTADKWAKKALELSKTKGKLSTTASNFEGRLNPTKRGEFLNSLKNTQKQFAEAGNLDEFNNILQSDFGLSPEGAASVAYPLSKSANEYVKQAPITTGVDFKNYAEKIETSSRKHAQKVADSITSNDSLLAIARTLREKDYLFNESAFFNELSENSDNFTQRQKDEISQGLTRDWFPNWGDILILPLFKERK